MDCIIGNFVVSRIHKIDFILPCICLVKRSQMTSKCGKDIKISNTTSNCSKTHSAIASCSCSYRILTSFVINYETDTRRHGINLDV